MLLPGQEDIDHGPVLASLLLFYLDFLLPLVWQNVLEPGQLPTLPSGPRYIASELAPTRDPDVASDVLSNTALKQRWASCGRLASSSLPSFTQSFISFFTLAVTQWGSRECWTLQHPMDESLTYLCQVC